MIRINDILQVEKHIDCMDVVLFDLDDTLYSEKDYVRSGYHKIAEWLNDSEIEGKLWTAFQKDGRALDEVLDEKDREEALKIYRFQQPDIYLYSGIGQMLERIGKKKKIGIITDGRPEGQRAKIKALGLMTLVDEVIITDELGGINFRKPNETAFVEMQKRFCTSFERMCYVGDNVNKDFIAPDKLGMKSIWFDNVDGLYK